MLMERNDEKWLNVNMNMKNEKNNPFSVNDIEVERDKNERMKRGERLKPRKESVRADNEESEYYGNIEKDEEEEDIEKKEKTKLDVERKNSEEEPDYEVYRFQDSGIGESWQLGDDSYDYGNAFKGGYSKCPVDIIVPRELKNEKGETRQVEVIGEYAYYGCGSPGYGYLTKTVLVTKQVRIIKYRGFGAMLNVTSFRIEDGSVLQSIEQFGLNNIGWNTGQYEAEKRGTLTFPSTLSFVADGGIVSCSLFNTIIYCGTHSLPNYCDLGSTKVKVINQYPAETIFGRTPLKDAESQAEVVEKCFGMSGNPFEKKCENSPENKVLSNIPLLCILLS